MKKIVDLLVSIAITGVVSVSSAAPHPSKPWIDVTYPQDVEKKWWSESWWEKGKLPVPQNFEVDMEETTYMDGEVEVNAYLFKPTKPGEYFPILFQHGRRGLDSWTLPRVKRLAARGFIVLAPDMFSTHMVEPFPIEHNYEYESHVAKGFNFLLERPGVLGTKACSVSHTRGGYMSLKALVSYNKQEENVSCYVSYYLHWQDPNLPEAKQIYQYAEELDNLKIPTMIFVGEDDQYQRIRPIIAGIKVLKENGVEAELIIYPGVGRGFEFRPSHVRTFADDLATKDAIQRTTSFVRKYLNLNLEIENEDIF